MCIRIGFNADQNLAYYLNADPDPESQNNADPDTGQTVKPKKGEFCMKNILKVQYSRYRTVIGQKPYLRKYKSFFERQDTMYWTILVFFHVPGSGSGTAKSKRIHNTGFYFLVQC